MTKTQKVISSQLLENTGKSILDSGGENGRAWQRWREKEKVDFTEDINKAAILIPIQRYLDNSLEYNSSCASLERKLKKQIEDLTIDFDRYILPKGYVWEEETFNTYNEDNDVSQDFQARMFRSEQKKVYYIMLSIHGGCDIRGGYSTPRIYKIHNHDDFVLSSRLEASDPNDPDGKSIMSSYEIHKNSYWDSDKKKRFWNKDYSGKEESEVQFWSFI